MKILLLLLGLVFFFIFFLFSQVAGIQGFFIFNLFWVANIYVLTVVLIILRLLFSPGTQGSTEYDDSSGQDKKNIIPTLEESGLFIKNFFSTYIYYIACAFFYGAFYLILKSMYDDVNASLLFFVLNIIVISLYFFESKIQIFQNFVRVNLVLISLYYIFIHSAYILGVGYQFTFLDICNILGVFLLFGILLGSSRGEKYLHLLRHYFIAFSFLEIATLIKIVFSGNTLSFGGMAFVFGIFFLIFTGNIRNITGFSKELIRFWGIIFSVIFIIISAFYIGQENFYVLVLAPALMALGYILFLFHKRFQNYISLSFGILAFMLAVYGMYSIIFSEGIELYYLSFLCFLFSVSIMIVDKVNKEGFIYDTYFLHSLSLLVNLLGVFCFLYFRDFSILSLGFLLLGESIYLFFSYSTLKKMT